MVIAPVEEKLKSPYQRHIKVLFETAHERTYAKNQLIHYQGDSLSNFYLVEEGFIKAYTILEAGDTRTIMLLSPGDIFPIAFSISLDWDNYHVKYFYQTMTDVKLRYIDRDILKHLIDTDPHMMQAYVEYLSASNQAILNQLEVMKNKKAINKVELLLPYLIMKLGEPIGANKYRIKIRLSHQEIADLCGVTRETTTALVKQLEKKSVLSQGKGFWIINAKKIGLGPFEDN